MKSELSNRKAQLKWNKCVIYSSCKFVKFCSWVGIVP